MAYMVGYDTLSRPRVMAEFEHQGRCYSALGIAIPYLLMLLEDINLSVQLAAASLLGKLVQYGEPLLSTPHQR